MFVAVKQFISHIVKVRRIMYEGLKKSITTRVRENVGERERASEHFCRLDASTQYLRLRTESLETVHCKERQRSFHCFICHNSFFPSLPVSLSLSIPVISTISVP